MILNRSAPKSFVNLCSAGRELKFSYLFINTYFKPFVMLTSSMAQLLALLCCSPLAGRAE